ncbi:MAG TPA: methylated-DNA--[protein]-cysteine S-methyltransferase [Candidatus Baltobacteraceae bacterium]|jgi:AraC family transcriptional regulator of adaptative response/methylated-DNA-[protein]-cysteine methyltransferase
MSTEYDRIAEAIDYLSRHVAEQPQLDDIATTVGVSPFHLQRMFRRWAGITPKQFLQFLTLERAKELLDERRSVLEVALESGLSSPARVHDHFVTLEAVTPGEYKGRGAGLAIRYGVAPTIFGTAFVAQTERGICAFAFVDNDLAQQVDDLRERWNAAELTRDDATAADAVTRIFDGNPDASEPLRLVARGTNFQVRVWRALLDIPFGEVRSYEQLARAIGSPKAARAVGNALARNTVGFLIPCHRVILSTGAVGSYRWSPHRKRALLAWEAARSTPA